jgi:3-dehydroquinate dehydratase type I
MKICISIGAETCDLLKKRVDTAIKLGADLVELRLDYLRTFSIDRVKDIVGRISDRCILTLRSSREGGRFRGSEEQRIPILYELEDLEPAYIDIELHAITKERGLSEVCSNTVLIVSKHILHNTPSTSTLNRWITEVLSYQGIGKIVSTAKKFEDNLRVMEALKQAPKGRLISFCMGEIGLVSRILAPLLGSPIVYTSLNEATAPGQIGLSEAHRLYSVLGYENRF